MALLTVENIHKRYGKEEVLKGVSFELERGETKVVIGPSGTGKSTLLRCINQLSPPEQGRVFLDGVEVTHAKSNINKLRAEIGFVFQTFNLMQTLSAQQNVELPMIFQGVRKKERAQRARELLAKVGLADRVRHRPNELSGGERQRVAIARALANNPDIILADEPTGNLDSESGALILDLLKRLSTDDGKTVIIVTHDPEAASIAGRIIRLRDGHVVEEVQSV